MDFKENTHTQFKSNCDSAKNTVIILRPESKYIKENIEKYLQYKKKK